VVKPNFDVNFLEGAFDFLKELDEKTYNKIIYNVDKARYINDPKLFKKLRDDIWEFRTKYAGLQYRLLAFWDKSTSLQTLVIATHGIVKKTDKMPENEINKAVEIKKQYLAQQLKLKKK